MEEVEARITADLRLLFPKIAVRIRAEDGSYVAHVFNDRHWWGSTSTSIDDGNDLDTVHVEQAIADVAEQIADNLWPHELTEPWPRCPRHEDHPLQPRLVRGSAAWTCSRDDSVALRIGSLATCVAAEPPSTSESGAARRDGRRGRG